MWRGCVLLAVAIGAAGCAAQEQRSRMTKALDALVGQSVADFVAFEVKPLRTALTSIGEAHDPKDQTIALLEKLAAARGHTSDAVTLDGLRRVQHIRSKVKGHAGSSEGKTLAQDALARHGTYGEHFKHICELIVQDLERIEFVLKP
jgi:hypothetical protein